jgi:dTDP-4-amino-4,6-dideoxygalactose transaminase
MNIIKFNEPYLTGNEERYIRDVFERKQFYGNGYYTEKCQGQIGEIISADQVLLTDSCTSALEISALLLREWDKEQEIILPSYTFSSTAAAFARAGFKIVFAEIESKTMMIDIEDVKRKITNKTSAIVIVHYGGFGADAKLFKELCDKNSIYMIEDAAQAFGCIENGKHLGTIGDLGCFSFHETKNLHAGLSGALVINNDKFSNKAIHIWERGTNRQEVLKGLADKYSWVEIGGSFYPTELQAAFLLAQLESYDQNKAQRKIIFDAYLEALLPLKKDNRIYFQELVNDFTSNYHAFWVLFNTEKECEYVRKGLVKLGINAFIGYVPLHTSKVGLAMGNKDGDLPITEEYSEKILRLPFHNNMSKDDADYVANSIIALLHEV